MHGFLRSGDFIKYIICGNTRKIIFLFRSAVDNSSLEQELAGPKGYSRESLAERWVGRDCFEGKVFFSHTYNWNAVMTPLDLSLDGTIGPVDGCIYSYAAVVQSFEVRLFRVYLYQSPISKVLCWYLSCLLESYITAEVRLGTMYIYNILYTPSTFRGDGGALPPHKRHEKYVQIKK